MPSRRLLTCACLLSSLACTDPGPAQPEDGSDTVGESETSSETGDPIECDEGTIAGDDGACHCGDVDGPICADTAYCDDAAASCVEPVCGELPQWSPGATLFEEATEAWGLTGIEGVRLNVTDVDGDGWADLLVRRGGTAADDFSGAGTRTTWLLRNLGADAGFEDITEASGVLATRQDLAATIGRPAAVVASADVDNDGDLDIFTGISTEDVLLSLGETSELMLNDGDGTFTLGPVTSALRLPDTIDSVAGASFVDINRDGVLDLWVTEHGLQDRLYYGDGSGDFLDATAGSGLTTVAGGTLAQLNDGIVHSRAWSALACDLDGDGYAELLAGSYGRSTNHLWQGHLQSGFVLFEPRGVSSGYGRDDDYEWQSNQFARCYCQANPMAEDCAGVPAPQISCTQPNWNHASDREPWRLGGNSGATACADLDNDGDMDLYTGEIRHWWAGLGSDMSEALLNVSDVAGELRFERPGRDAMGIAVEHVTGSSWDEGHMTLTTLDVDNDGRRDVYVGGSDYAGRPKNTRSA
jgi:hypothetical protein